MGKTWLGAAIASALLAVRQERAGKLTSSRFIDVRTKASSERVLRLAMLGGPERHLQSSWMGYPRTNLGHSGLMRSGDFFDTRPSLLAALQAGSAAGGGAGKDGRWREFFDLYAPPIYRVAIRRRLSAADAEDVVQQVMLAIVEHIDGFQYERDRARFRSWVLRIAENTILNVRRRRRPEAATGVVEAAPDGNESIEDAWEQEWRYQDMMYCLEQVAADVSPRRMLAFRLYALQGVSAEETARQLGTTVGNVYAARTRVLAMIRLRMQKLQSKADRSDGSPAPVRSPLHDGSTMQKMKRACDDERSTSSEGES